MATRTPPVFKICPREARESFERLAKKNAAIKAAAHALLAALRESSADLRHYVATHGAGPDERLVNLEHAQDALAKSLA